MYLRHLAKKLPVIHQEEIDTDPYVWSWPLWNNRSTAVGLAEFANGVVDEYIKTIYELQLMSRLGSRTPQFRFSAVPTGQVATAFRPDFGLFPIHAFREEDSEEFSSNRASKKARIEAPTASPDFIEDLSHWNPPNRSSVKKNANMNELELVSSASPSEDHAAYSAWERARRFTVLDVLYWNFSQARVVGEANSPTITLGRRRLHPHVRAKRRAQPWKLFTFGLALTKTGLCLVRADASGVEECAVDYTTSLGVVELIRTLSGLCLSSEEELGQDPVFTLKEVDVEGQRRRQVDTIRGLDATTYQIHRMLFDKQSIRGRGTRVWSASRSDHPRERLALRVVWVDPSVSPSEDEMIARVRDKGVKSLILPDEDGIWRTPNTSTITSLRGYSADMEYPVEDRVQLWTRTPERRPLRRFCSLREVAVGLISGLQAIASLADDGQMVHSDISDHNLVLPLEPASAQNRADYGLIDLSLAFLLREDEPNISAGPHIISGTPPFIDFRLMNDPNPVRHTPAHDVTSIFLVLYLIFFTHDKPTDMALYSKGRLDEPLPYEQRRRWPKRVEAWTSGHDHVLMGNQKQAFFTHETHMIGELRNYAAPHWCIRPGELRPEVESLVLNAWRTLWKQVEIDGKTQGFLADTKPQALVAVLEKWLVENPHCTL